MVSTHCKDSSSSNSEAQRDLPENRPEGEEQYRIGKEGQDQSQSNLHLSLSLHFILDQPRSEDPDNVDRDMGDEREQEEW